MTVAATVRLTMSQALLRYLMAQHIEVDGVERPYFEGVWAIFGHGNVAGIGEALHEVKDHFPTWRAHNEQGMANASIAFAKTRLRTGAMVCSTSIGPGATNLVTSAALAHVNRLPILLLPSDVFANRRPDPVLQQIEDFGDGTMSVTDCFRPVSRYYDRITRPEQIIVALPRAMATFFDPATCGPVTLALCQDVQAEAYDYPESFFQRRVWRMRRPEPDAVEFAALVEKVRSARRPLIVAGGGVLYAGASDALRRPAVVTRASECFCAHPFRARARLAGATAAEDQPHAPIRVSFRLGRPQLVLARPQRPVRQDQAQLVGAELSEILSQSPGGSGCAQSAR